MLGTVGAPSVPLRERKKQATRNALRRAALDLVARRGLAGITVEEIAASADVSPRTFFNYFPSKEDAVIGWDPSVVEEMIEGLGGRPPEEGPLAALRAMLFEQLAPRQLDHRELLERLRLIRSDPNLLAHHAQRWGETERQLVAALAKRRGTDPVHDHYAALVVAAVLAAGRTALMSWCDKEGSSPLVDEVARHLDVLAAGLAEAEGEAL